MPTRGGGDSSSLHRRHRSHHGIYPPLRALRIAEALSDVEHAVETQETFKRWFSRWLRIHIVLTVALYLLLALHIAAGLYLGLRWL